MVNSTIYEAPHYVIFPIFLRVILKSQSAQSRLLSTNLSTEQVT
jgi:hypothetical protein